MRFNRQGRAENVVQHCGYARVWQGQLRTTFPVRAAASLLIEAQNYLRTPKFHLHFEGDSIDGALRTKRAIQPTISQ